MTRNDGVDAIVSMGHTAAEAERALHENGGNVDDAIDFLFTGGRANKMRAEKDKVISQNKGLFDIEQGSESDKSSSGASTTPSLQGLAVEEGVTPIPTRDSRQATIVRPGAFAVGDHTLASLTDDLVAGSLQGTSLADIIQRAPVDPFHRIQAELVDPDKEKRVLEQRLAQELEAEHQRAAVALPVSEDELKTCRWRRVACVIGVVVVAFAVALSVALTRPPVETQPPTPAPTFPPPPQEIIDLIKPKSFDDGASLYDSSSPQSAAARWLADNTYLDSYNDERKLQRYALATLYFSTNGDAWADKQEFMTDINECEWREADFSSESSLHQCDADDAVTRLLFKDNNMIGTIPEEIAFLSDSLFTLWMNGSQLRGTLPSTLGLLTTLKELRIRDNNVTSAIPVELASLSRLHELILDKNRLNGTIPLEMTQMTSLKKLYLNQNLDLNGTISSTLLGSLTSMERLRLFENKFTGTISTEIGLLTLLEQLELHENKITGSLPTEIGLLIKLKELTAHKNALTGRLPTELGLLTLLEQELRLQDNNFSGPIPSELCLLPNLMRLRLAVNSLTGTILSCIGLMLPNLERLELKENHLVGSIPSELGLLSQMTDLRLFSNKLTGTILPEFGTFPNLKDLYFGLNSLTGPIPAFGNLTKFKYLHLQFNKLTGIIPSSIARLPSLQDLVLDNNALTGTIPALSNFTYLQEVRLYNNSFSGPYTCPLHVTDCFLSCADPNNTSCRVLSP